MTIHMDENELARALLSHERREWQNPEEIVEGIGVSEGMTVADLACGPGFFTVPMARVVGQRGRVFAVDSSEVMLRYLRSNIERDSARLPRNVIKVIEADITQKTEIPSSSVDVVFFANILHDLATSKASMKRFFVEVKRIAKRIESSIIVDVDWKKVDNGFGPDIEIRLSESQSERILSEMGMGIRKEVDAGPYHYGFVCEYL